MIALNDFSFWNMVAGSASAVAMWAQAKARKPSDPIEDLTDRLRNPRRRALQAFQHPVRTWKRRVS